MAIRKPIVEVAGSLTELSIGDTLPLFTSSSQGEVSASGGGTSNFLRADNVWAVPSGGTSTVSYEPSFLLMGA
jgi:hypothetical protein